MKRLLLFALVAMAVACSPEIVWDENNQNQNDKPNNNQDPEDSYCVDWAPLGMFVYLHDAEGNNLFDIESEHYYDVSQIKVTYNGEEYDVMPPYQPSAKPLDYLALFKQPYISRDYYGNTYLYIGDWDRIENWESCSVEIAWGDETKDVLSFTHAVAYNPEFANDPDNNFGYSFTTKWYLNGQSNENGVYYFVK